MAVTTSPRRRAPVTVGATVLTGTGIVGMTPAVGADGGLRPTAFAASTVNLYVSPGVRPVMVVRVALPGTVTSGPEMPFWMTRTP